MIPSLTLASHALSQMPPEGPIVVQVTSQSVSKMQQQTLDIRVTNVSTTDVKGFVLRIELLDDKGNLKFVTDRMQLSGGLPEKAQVLSPGQSVDMEWQIPLAGPQPSYRLSTDYVALVRDASTLESSISTLEDWGPDKSQLSERIKGILTRLHDERKRLRQLTESQTAAALSSDLDNERPAPEASSRRSNEYRMGLQTAYKLERKRLRDLLHQQGKGTSFVVDDLELNR